MACGSSSSSDVATRMDTAGLSGFDGGPSSSSGFTDEEILAELQDLGYSLSPEQLEGLKKELDKILEKDEVLERQQQSAYVQRLTQTQNSAGSTIPSRNGNFPPRHQYGLLKDSSSLAPENYQQQLLAEGPFHPGQTEVRPPESSDNMNFQFQANAPSPFFAHPAGPEWKYRNLQDTVPGEIEELLEMTEDRTRKSFMLMRQESERLAKQYPHLEDIIIEREKELRPEAGATTTKSVRFQDSMNRATAAYERRALRELGQTIRENLPKMDGLEVGELQLPEDEMEMFMKASARVVKGDKLLEPTIRPVECPEAGGLPFRHDPVKRFQLYKREWAKHPAPGEKKRLDLRWKVREYMLRQDIPKLVQTSAGN